MRIATDKIEETGPADDGKNKAAVELGSKGRNQWQLDHTGTREAAKGIGLVSPVQVTWPRGITLGHVLGALVVGPHSRHGVSNTRDVTGRAHSARDHGIRVVR
jgi:hypothetical protein